MKRLTTLLLLLAAVSGSATTVQEFSLEDLADRSDRAFLGLCISVETRLHQGHPYQLYRFHVEETLKGPQSEMAELHVPGGIVDGQREWLAGMPVFSPGSRAVVFLTGPDRHGVAWPLGLGQGHFRVDDGTASKPVVHQQLQGLSRASTAAKPAVQYSGVELEAFLILVRQLVSPVPPEADRDSAR